MHYVGSLAVVVAGLIIKEAWLAGFGSALMFTWVIRARRM